MNWKPKKRVLDAIRLRPDINCLHIYYFDLVACEQWAQKLEELLNLNDRSWTIHFQWPGQYPYDSTPQAQLTRALSVLRNVQYLHVGSYHRLSLDQRIKFFRSLPNFQNLKGIDCLWCTQEQLKLLFLEAPFASKLYGIHLGTTSHRGYTEPIFSSEVAPHIHTIRLPLDRSPSSLRLNEAVVKLPCLKTLHIDLSSIKTLDDVPKVMGLFKWLRSPDCPVTALSIGSIQPGHWKLVLAGLKYCPKLVALHLQFTTQVPRLRKFCRRLLRLRCLESVTLCAIEFHEQLLGKFFEFQRRKRRPLVFTLRAQQENNPGIEKIHFVSSIYQTLRNLQRSKQLGATFPLLSWASILEKLAIGFDCPSTHVQAVGVETIFTALQELLGDPLRFVDHAELCNNFGVVGCTDSNSIIAGRVKRAKRRRLF